MSSCCIGSCFKEKIKQQIDLISNDVNALQEEQKLMKEKYVNVKKEFKEWKDEEEKFKRQLQKNTGQVMNEVESILSKNYIERPYYHSGKHNGKAMVCLMDYSHSSKITDEISMYLLSIPELLRS